MTEFILWCNENQGFASLLLSALTLLVSIIALGVSIRTAKLPYKKKLLVNTGTYISINRIGLHITVTNVGNRNVKIKNIGFLLSGNNVYINSHTLFDSQVVLTPGGTTSQYYDVDDFRKAIKGTNTSENTMIKAFVEDTEGKKYKKILVEDRKFIKKIVRVKDICK
ncbi:MAG: hypothetical protein IJE54_01235 [Peptococcaceae bacterium]|nr:hypothetical protein [Peptococcaceae bacterium]MBQ3510249.1 hypothetical protein [Peptococcaceae bacterium]MBQ6887064.1 hypothetical protein [Lachnospiraceae bacterium]